MTLRPLAFALALFGLPVLPAQAAAIVTLDHGSVWQTAKDGQDTQGFIEIHNTGDAPDTLTGANCSIAASTVLVDGGGNPLASLDIAPGQTVILSGNGPHLLIKGARYRVQRNGILPCAFTFAQSGALIGYLNAVPAPGS
jgi:copper(I)-binding protein